jgi:hypothetical protein
MNTLAQFKKAESALALPPGVIVPHISFLREAREIVQRYADDRPANFDPQNAVVNRGWQTNFISGITGVAVGGNAVVNLDVNKRYHGLIFQCTAVNYTGGAGKQIINIKVANAAAAGATATATLSNGAISSVAVVNGGNNYTTGDTVSIQDATGTGAVLTVTAAVGVITAFTVTTSGTPSPINPATMLTSIRLLVNGVNMRDITPGNVIAISQANGYLPLLGNLPIFFTAPWRTSNVHNEISSWDMNGQSTFQVQIGISGTVTSPGVTGVYIFDYNRNAVPVAGNPNQLQAFLQPVSQHQFSFPLVAGRNDLNQLPFSYPIARLWFNTVTAGNITQVEIYQDGNKIFEATTSQMLEQYSEWGFCLNTSGNTTIPNGNTLGAPFAAAYISDPDQRPEKALSVQNSFIVRITVTAADTLTIVQEMLPGAYQS